MDFDRRRFVKSVVAAYIVTIMMSFVVGFLGGMTLWMLKKFVVFHYENELISFGWVMIIAIIWVKYDKLQKYSENIALDICVMVGTVVMFLLQFFQAAVVEKDYSYSRMIILFFYLTMIFTAFMLLQHNRLTAKQQAIEEDNRQMSQRLHRSKDVLGVVSQVVASEEHIDPKLRKELADFCDDEMNEMQDRTLGVNLIGDTGIELVNVMLQKQMMRCADLNISFDVMIPAPVDGYIQNIGISVTEFMRMLNDLLNEVVLSRNDYMKEKRIELINSLFDFNQSASEKIIKYLEKYDKNEILDVKWIGSTNFWRSKLMKLQDLLKLKKIFR